MNKRIGLIEVGSKTIRYLVADFDPFSDFQAVDTESVEHNIQIDQLKRTDVEELNVSVAVFKERLLKYKCEFVEIYGTEICRKMEAAFPNLLSRSVRILDGNEEALASWAAGFMCERNRSKTMNCTIVDMGTGSTEIVTATIEDGGMRNLVADSFKFGTHELVGQYAAKPDGYVRLLHTRIDELQNVLLKHMRPAGQSKIYLLGGGATKNAWIKVRRDQADRYKPHLVNGVSMMNEQLLKTHMMLSTLYKKNPQKVVEFVDSRSGSEDEALRTISSAAFLSLLASALGYHDQIYFSGYGTRHGVAFLMLNGMWKFAKEKDPLTRV